MQEVSRYLKEKHFGKHKSKRIEYKCSVNGKVIKIIVINILKIDILTLSLNYPNSKILNNRLEKKNLYSMKLSLILLMEVQNY